MRAVTRTWPLVLVTVACACMSSGRKLDNPADGSKEGGVVDSAVATGPTASGWPEADLLFHKDAHWVGADDAYSVDLGGGRVLWLFAVRSFLQTQRARAKPRPSADDCVCIMNRMSDGTARFEPGCRPHRMDDTNPARASERRRRYC